MKTVLMFTVLFNEVQDQHLFNLPLFIASMVILLIALYICVRVTRRNRLYIHYKKKPRTKAYI